MRGRRLRKEGNTTTIVQNLAAVYTTQCAVDAGFRQPPDRGRSGTAHRYNAWPRPAPRDYAMQSAESRECVAMLCCHPACSLVNPEVRTPSNPAPVTVAALTKRFA